MPNLPTPGAIRWTVVHGMSGRRSITLYYPSHNSTALGTVRDLESDLFYCDAPTVEDIIEQITEWLREHPEDAQK